MILNLPDVSPLIEAGAFYIYTQAAIQIASLVGLSLLFTGIAGLVSWMMYRVITFEQRNSR